MPDYFVIHFGHGRCKGFFRGHFFWSKKMSNVYYGKIDDDHYGFDLTPARMGDNYVEITTEEHFRLIDSGMNIVPDENGYPTLVPYPEPTEEEKAQTEIYELENYLKSTDWYSTRFAETGKEIPIKIKEKREQARVRISELRGLYNIN